ncbi:MAG: hypothetical protein ACOQNV_01875 [Mycoplasmoidaceae bacterium]
MKLVNKFLTALSPVAMVGVITPTLVACNKGSSYTIHYGQAINCLTKKEKDYQSLSTIQNSVKSRANLSPKGSLSIDDINTTLKTDAGFQNIYYDIVASLSIMRQEHFRLFDWSDNFDDQTVKFSVVDIHGLPQYFNNVVTYAVGEHNDICIKIGGVLFVSYTYKDVTPK